jgi:hypothetical protein
MPLTFDPLSAVLIIIAIVVVVILTLLPRFGPHTTSRLTCPNCKKVFNFHFVPGASIASIFHKNTRTLKCPYCHVKSTYDVMSTRVAKQKKPVKAKVKA